MRRIAHNTNRSAIATLPPLALVFLLGDLALQSLPALPSVVVLSTLALASIVLFWRWPRRLASLAVVLIGFTWSGWCAHSALQARLPTDLAGRDFLVTGTISDLPQRHKGVDRFRLRVQHASLDGRPFALDGQLRLAWYGHGGTPLEACQRWQLRLRLKPPRGMINPGGYDSELHALAQGVVAVGYVRAAGPNRQLGDGGWCINRWRGKLSAAIATQLHGAPVTALLQALAVGDKRGLDERDWQTARVTGISHLLAISGFHIGVAALLGIWLAGCFWRLLSRGRAGVPRQMWQAAVGLLLAFAYALLAGMGLPARRALIMIAVVRLTRLLRRGVRPVDSLLLALLVVLVLDPLAVLSASLWLSFVAVAFLLLGLVPATAGWRGWLAQLGRAQVLMSVALLPLAAWFFGQASVLGAPVNLLVVPLVSLLVVPLTLLGSLLWPSSGALAGLLWRMAGWLLQGMWSILEHLSAWPAAQWFLPQPGWPAMLLALLGAVWLLLPRGLPARGLGALLFLPLLLPQTNMPQTGDFRVTVLDVGQGLSVLVHTRQHSLLYDAGARYPSGFDLGQAVVIPALHAVGVRRLDMLMVSHGDNDHAGGAPAVARMWPQAALTGSEPKRTHLPLEPCRTGQHWTWDRVDFRVLHPDGAWPEGSNDGSCVLLVSGSGGRMLLTGDITRLVEPVVADHIAPGPPLVLLVPHHGSKTSSSRTFLDALKPRLAVASAGWHNRFGHPAPVVAARYRQARIPLLVTADAGAVVLDFPAESAPVLRRRLRCDDHHYWRLRACLAAPDLSAKTAIMRPSTDLPE